MYKLFLTLFALLSGIFVYGQNIPEISNLTITDRTITLSGLGVEINSDGFVKQILTFYKRDHSDEGRPLLFEPFHFHYYSTPKAQIKLNPTVFKLISASKDAIIWNALSGSDELKQEITGEMLANGFVKYKIRLKALKDVMLNTVNFHIPFQKTAAKYLAGLSQTAGLRADTVKWDWNGSGKVVPAVWIGDERQGLYLSLDDRRSFNDAKLKNGWINEGKGKLQINIKGSSMLVEFNTGNINLKQGEELAFDCNLIVSQSGNLKKVFNPAKKFKAYRRLEIKSRRP